MLPFFWAPGLLICRGVPDENLGLLSFGWRMVFAIPVSMIAIAMLAILLDRILYQPLRRKKSGTIILAMAALGASFIIQMIILILWGADSLFYRPGVLRPALELPWEIKIRPDQIFIVLVVFLSITALHLFLKHTRMQRAMRATADNPELARVTGIDTGRIIHWTWGIGGAMAALGGILYGIDVQLHPGMGWGLLLPLFAAT